VPLDCTNISLFGDSTISDTKGYRNLYESISFKDNSLVSIRLDYELTPHLNNLFKQTFSYLRRLELSVPTFEGNILAEVFGKCPNLKELIWEHDLKWNQWTGTDDLDNLSPVTLPSKLQYLSS
jgi:hypothetical protein